MIPILAWHKVDTRFEFGATRIGPRLFRRQVEALASRGYSTLGASDLVTGLPGGTPGGKRVVLTFDDGYAGLAEHAFPVLAELGMRALVFVITDYVGRDNSWDLRLGGISFAHLDWDTLGRWQERGIEVHSHGATHTRLTWLPDSQVADELGRSREAITARLGTAPAVICYPFGAVDARVAALGLSAGYAAGMAGANGVVKGDPMRLGRLMVYPWDRGTPPLVLDAGVAGGAARLAARVVNRLAVVTALLKSRGGGAPS